MKKRINKFFFLSKITLLIVSKFYSSYVYSEDSVEFENKFLQGGNFGKVNVDLYAKGNPVLPGEYSVSVYLNDKEKLSNIKVTFINNNTNWATPCIYSDILEQLDLNESALKNAKQIDVASDLKSADGSAQCYDLQKSYDGATVHYDPLTLRLDITLPQIYLQERPEDYVSPKRWDQGIPAILLSWDASAYHNRSNGGDSDSIFSSVMYGANLAGWRMRGRGSFNWDKNEGGVHYTSQDAYLQHDIAALRSQMLVGDSNTNGDIFDSWSVRGVRLHDDRQMLPNSVSGYSPVVRGVARTQAKVSVRQNGYTIYQTTVSPGAFALTDVMPGGYGNDLEVTVEETDGTKSSFVVPYSSVAQMVRPGYGRWEIAAGELYDNTLRNKPNVVMVTGAYGLTNYITTYAGVQGTDTKYTAGLMGMGVNTPIGAIAADITQSRAQFNTKDTSTLSGQSYRLTYTSEIQSTNTNFTMAAYRFSTQHYLSLSDAAQMNDDLQDGSISDEGNYQRLKNQLQLNITQPLRWSGKDYGSFYITGTWDRYWGDYKGQQFYSAGYSNSVSWLSYSVSLQRTRNDNGDEDNSLYANFVIPLGMLTNNGRNPYGFSMFNSGINTDFSGNVQTTNSASGSSEDGSYGYSINTSLGADNGVNSAQVGGSGSYHGGYGNFNASASHSNSGDQQMSVGTTGGIVLHSGGFAFVPETISEDESLALISAPGAEGARVNSGYGEINKAGYALSSYLSPYRENNVGLDINSMENDVEIKNTSSKVVPTSGAVVKVDFSTDQGRSFLFTLQRSDKSFIPLGAEVFDEKGRSVGDVGQGGYAYVRGIADRGVLRVAWGKHRDESCLVEYSLPTELKKSGKTTVLPEQSCRMSGASSAQPSKSVMPGDKVKENVHAVE